MGQQNNHPRMEKQKTPQILKNTEMKTSHPDPRVFYQNKL